MFTKKNNVKQFQDLQKSNTIVHRITHLSLFPAKLKPTPEVPFTSSITSISPGKRQYFFLACSAKLIFR